MSRASNIQDGACEENQNYLVTECLNNSSENLDVITLYQMISKGDT